MLAHRPLSNNPSHHHSNDIQNNTTRYNGGPSVHQLPPELFIAIFDFETQEEDQIHFKRGDVLPIVLKEPSGWWAAFVDGRYGWVPAAFLEPWIPHQDKSGAAGPSPGLSMSDDGDDRNNPSPDAIGMRSRGSITAPSVADLPEYTEEDTHDDQPSILSPEYEYYPNDGLGHDRRRSSEYTEEEPTTPGGMGRMGLDDNNDDDENEDPLVSDLVAPFSAGGLGQSRRTGASSALPPYAISASPTSYNNYKNFNSRNGGGNGGSHGYAPTYDPPLPHQLSLVLEEGSDVNSQWSMTHSSQAFSHTSSASALNQMALQGSGGDPQAYSSPGNHTNSNTNSGSLQPPTSPLSPNNSNDASIAALHRQRIAYLSTPWYLRPKHAWDELRLNAEGLVVAGTAPALIERLVMDSTLAPNQEAALRSTLLLTFKSWTTAEVLYDSLLQYYTMEEPEGLEPAEALEWKEKMLRPTQMRVLCVFGLWIEKHGLMVDDPGLVPRLRTWLSTILTPAGLAASAKHLVQSIDRIQQADDSSGQTSTTSPISPFVHLGASLRRKPKPPKADFMKWEASEIANHLTLAEARAYSRIRPFQCLAWAQAGGKVMKDVAGLRAEDAVSPGGTAGGDQDGGIRNLMAFIAGSDRLAIWVKNTVLGCESLGKRTDMVDFWIKIADRCRNLNNIFATSAIIAALSGSDIGKLTLTWAHISRASNFEQMVELTDPIGNFSAYRAFHDSLSNQPDGTGGSGTTAGAANAGRRSPSSSSSTSAGSSLSLSISTLTGRDSSSSSTGPACVPFISPFLTDLMHINDRFPTTVQTSQGPEPSQTPPRPLINVVKLQRQADVISNMLRFADRIHLTGSQPSGGKGATDGYRSLVEKENPAMFAAMDAQMEAGAAEVKKDAAYFWKRSQELQKMEVTHADIWKNLNNAGF